MLRIRWEDEFSLGLDPEKARSMHDETMPKQAHKVVYFCSVKITQGVRNYAEERGIELELAVEEGVLHKAEEFREQGAEIYKEV